MVYRSRMNTRLTADLASGALTEALADIAEDAARVILPYWRSGVVAETKADASPVTRADREAEALILARLEALYPGVQAVAEEAVAVDGAPAATADWFWLIDPLDGTRGFVEGRESYTVNIALIHKGAVVAGVVPFNFPLMVPLWMLPQALVGGNAFVLKPSEQVPLSMLRLAELFVEAGLPAGIFNLVHGGKDVVEALCDHPDIAALGFVGSTPVAKLVYGRACATGKRALCLGGAKNHLLVVPDADVELTADNVVASFTGCAGQRCMAAAVMVAVGEVDHIVDEIKARAEKLELGRDLGAITSQAAMERITRYIDDAEKMGAKVLVDGRGKRAADGGYWVGPTILDGVSEDMPAWKDEIFGPVLSIVARRPSARRSSSRTRAPTATPRASTPPAATSPAR